MAKSHYIPINPETSDSSEESDKPINESLRRDIGTKLFYQSFDSSQSAVSQQE